MSHVEKVKALRAQLALETATLKLACVADVHAQVTVAEACQLPASADSVCEAFDARDLHRAAHAPAVPLRAYRVQPLDDTGVLDALGIAVPSVRRNVERHRDRADLDESLRRLAACTTTKALDG